MRYSRFLILLLFTIGLVGVHAQDAERKHSIGVYQNFTDYNLSLLNNKVVSFDSAFSQSARIAYQRRLSRTWMLNVGLANGFINNQQLNENFIDKAYVVGLDAAVMFKFNNGRLIKENPVIAPFLSFGYRTDYVNKLKKLEESPWLFHNQFGAGFNVKITPRTHIQLQTAIDQKLLGDFSTNMQYRIGLTQSLGRMEDKAPIQNPKLDSDRDGIVDLIDKCPGLFGTASNKGCPDTTAVIAKKIQNDSLTELVAIQNEKIATLELQNAKLRSGGAVETTVSPVREKELLAKIASMESSHAQQIGKLLSSIENNDKIASRVDTVYIKELANNDKPVSNDEALAAQEKAKQDKEELRVQLKAERIAREDAERRAILAKEEARRQNDENKTAAVTKVEAIPEIPINKNYYVITISSPNLSTAQAWQRKMEVDFSDARILPQPNGYYRVGVFAARDRELAGKILEQVKASGYNPAWLSVE